MSLLTWIYGVKDEIVAEETVVTPLLSSREIAGAADTASPKSSKAEKMETTVDPNIFTVLYKAAGEGERTRGTRKAFQV